MNNVIIQKINCKKVNLWRLFLNFKSSKASRMLDFKNFFHKWKYWFSNKTSRNMCKEIYSKQAVKKKMKAFPTFSACFTIRLIKLLDS